MAADFEKLSPQEPDLLNNIRDKSINAACAYLAKERRELEGPSKHARKKQRASTRDTLAQINKSKAVSNAAYNDEPTFDWYIKKALQIANSLSGKEHADAVDRAVKCLRGEITPDQLPKYRLQTPQLVQVNDAPSIMAEAA